MRVLLCNDDGIDAPGLWHAFEALSHFDCEVVAPLSDQSGVSHSTACFRTPLTVYRRRINGVGATVVAGTPADAVKFRLCGGSAHFDVMVSGINPGENSGIAHYHSGTVAAAREAALRGVPAVSISVWRDSPEQFRAAASFLRTWLPRWFGEADSRRPSTPTLLNVNFPDGDPAAIRGIYIARQSMACFDDSFEEHDDQADAYTLVFGDRKLDQIQPGSDDWALRHGYITMVPLRLDLTCMESVEWLRAIHGNGPHSDGAAPGLRMNGDAFDRLESRRR
jgi:5'/3'-nucleotidase